MTSKTCSGLQVAASFVFCLSLFMGAFAPRANAQGNTATVTGVVSDSSGGIIPGASVTITSTETGVQKTDTTDPSGRYTVPNLQPGFYDVQVSQQGFSTMVEKRRELLVGSSVEIDFTMQVSTTSQTVEVHAEALVATTQSTVATTLETRQLDDLPSLSRNFAELATLTPGVESAGVNTTGQAAGSAAKASILVSIGNIPTYSTNYMVDGVTNEGGNQGGPYVAMAQDWVREFSVLNLQFPAEYGAAGGGVVNTVTRSGSNSMHGRVYGFFQNSALNSNPEFYTGTTKAPSGSQREGGMIGGPIKRNKLFYFLGFEYFNSYLTATFSSAAQSAPFASRAQPFGTPPAQLVPWLIYGTGTSAKDTGISKLAMARFDYTPSGKDSFLLRSNLDYEYTTNGGIGGSSTFGVASSQFSPNYTETVGWTRTLSPSMVNEFFATFMSKLTNDEPNYIQIAGNYSGVTLNQNPYNYVTTQSLGGQTPFGNPDGYWANVSYNNVSTGSATTKGVHSSEVDEVFSDALTYTTGNHEFKFGGLIRRYDIVNHNGDTFFVGSYTYAAAATAPFDPNNVLQQTPVSASFSANQKLAPLSYFVNYPFSAAALNYHIPSLSYGLFAQDSWKIKPNFTLNIGVRYDFNTMNSALYKDSYPILAQLLPGSHGFTQPGFTKINNDPLDISPRIGIAWSPFRDGKRTVIRGGFGVFYDQEDTAPLAVYAAANSAVQSAYTFSANTATTNPYCIGNNSCAAGIPVADEIAVQDVLASALANFTLPQFPVSTSPCATTNSCKVTVGPNTYTIPALSVPFNLQGGRLNVDPNFKVTGTTQATIGLEHQFGSKLTVSADFVYRYMFHGPNSVNTNVTLTGVGASQTYIVPNPSFTTTPTYISNGYLKARDLDVKATYRDLRGDSVTVAYQFGYSNDNSRFNFGYSGRPTNTTNPFDPNYDYGPSFNDARNILNVASQIPLYWGIQFSPIVTYTGALPFSATSSVQAPGSQLAPPGCQAYFSSCYPAGYSRNSLRGDSFFSLNARLSKNVKITESKSISVFAEGFNLTNKHNLGVNFNANVDNQATFLTPTHTSLPLRQFQFGARFDF